MKNNNPLRIPDIVAKRRREGHPMWKGGRHVRFKWGFHTTQEWEQLKKQYNYMCPCCHKREPQIRLEKDHIVSATEGGPDIIENIQPLCRECNVKKGNWTIYYRTNKFYSGKRVSEKIKSMEVKRSNWEKDMRNV
jgi:5-methylcytosine-specific restriction endonuclease McrA